MAQLLKEAWTSELIKNFFNDDSFLMDGRDDSALVDNDFINEAQAGAPTDVTINATYPLPTTSRTDIAQGYALVPFMSDVRTVSDLELVALSYNKKQSMIADDKAQLQQKVADYLRQETAIADTSNTAGIVIMASGSSTFVTSDGTNRTLKLPTKKDIGQLTVACNMRNLPKAGRIIIMSPDVFQAFIESDEEISSQIILQAAAKSAAGNINVNIAEVNIWGWTFRERVGSVDYTGSVGNGFQKIPLGGSLAGSASSMTAYIKGQTWSKAIGTVKMFERIGDPAMQADTYSFLVRAGGYIRDARSAGVILLTP